MNGRQRNPKVRIALVCTNNKATRFRDRKIDPGDADFPRQEFVTQMLSCCFGQILRVGCSGVGSQVFVVRQALLGRPQLEYTARETGLDKRATTVEEQEDLIDGLLKNIVVATGRSGEGRRLFTISFRDRDRAMAVSVVDTLLQTFVQDVLKKA